MQLDNEQIEKNMETAIIKISRALKELDLSILKGANLLSQFYLTEDEKPIQVICSICKKPGQISKKWMRENKVTEKTMNPVHKKCIK